MVIDRTSPAFDALNRLASRKPAGHYEPFVICDNLIYLSGQASIRGPDLRFIGQVGRDLSVAEGYEAARVCMENLLLSLRDAVNGDWDRVVRCVKLTGFINSQAPFADGPKVMNGASDLLLTLFGPTGQHARSAVGVAALPGNAAVEVEAVFQLRPDHKTSLTSSDD